MAGAVTWFLGRLLSGTITQGDGDNPGLRVVQGIFTLVGGMLIVPLLVIAFFASQSALGRLYYYVITHNLIPSDDLWSLLIARTRDIRFWLFIFTLSGG